MEGGGTGSAIFLLFFHRAGSGCGLIPPPRGVSRGNVISLANMETSVFSVLYYIGSSGFISLLFASVWRELISLTA